MKTSISFKILLMALACSLVSCDDFLTQVPETGIPESQAMTDLESAEEVVIGVYSSLKNSALYSGTLTQVPDVQSDLCYAAVGFSNQYGPFHRWEQDPNTTELLSMYSGLYEIIARCNFFMDHAEQVRATLRNESERKTMDKYEGDVHFMRAMAYSDLIRLFCIAYDPATAESALGVPLYLHYREGDGSTVIKPRATLQQSYAQVLADLDAAESLVTRNGSDTPFVTIGAVYALKARIYLMMCNWQQAVDYATKVIDLKSGSAQVYELASVGTYKSTGSGVITEYQAMWEYDTADEIILKVAFTTDDRGGSLGRLFMNLTGGYYAPQYIPARWLINSYTASDGRYSAFFTTATTTMGVTTSVFVKYPGNPDIDGSAGPYYVNMPKLLRLGETYLIRAEAYCMMGETAKANKDLTTLLKSRITSYGAASYEQSKLLAAIQTERAKELVLEGFRLSDLKRWKLGFERQPQTGALEGERYTSLKIQGTDKRFTWPIPQHEITASQGQVIQNEQ